jgi:hypothetical protein
MSIMQRIKDIIFDKWHERKEQRPVSRREYAEAFLTARAAKKTEPLDWRRSVVDLLKVLDEDSSLQARKSLAIELGYDGDPVESDKMNVWLHAAVMKHVESGEFE